MQHKGIVLAGGAGTRLYPITKGVSKQLLSIYDKPMVYYPISVLMLAGIKEILIITTPDSQASFQQLLGDGSQFGCCFYYLAQETPKGIADAFRLGADFIGHHPVALVLGDNLFYGQGLAERLKTATNQTHGATVFTYQVKDPERFAVVEYDSEQGVRSIVEKPRKAHSRFAVTGLYFYDNQVVEIAQNIRPSARGELEITDINNIYLAKRALQEQTLGRGFIWLDAGTHDSLLEAGQLVQSIEARQGYKIACLEEIACRQGWISTQCLRQSAEALSGNPYGDYMQTIADEIEQRQRKSHGLGRQ